MSNRYDDFSDMSLEEEYVRVVNCKKCRRQVPLIEKELSDRGYTAREIRNVRQLT